MYITLSVHGIVDKRRLENICYSDYMNALPLFKDYEEEKVHTNEFSEWGTFKDSLKAPVHGWFTYPAGFSYKAVEHTLKLADLNYGDTVYDPFMGSGTTNVVAKSMGINSIGVEAHPFVYCITKSKMEWDITLQHVGSELDVIQKQLSINKYTQKMDEILKVEFPELILKCFLPETLYELWIIRNTIAMLKCNDNIKSFLRTALICTLREVSIAATGWPYIAPKKIKVSSMIKKGWKTYISRVYKMLGDLSNIKKNTTPSTHRLYCGDSRDTTKYIDSEIASYIFTSPPYLNNFDYADRTRLEMYFMGEADNWHDISDKIRTKLMTSATTQISRSDPRYEFSINFIRDCKEVYDFLANSIIQLSELRKVKGGKKSYDLMTIGYFNDIYQILKDNYRILKYGSSASYVLGDSAPYGIHIPTDELIGKIGVSIGFKDYKIKILRLRGGKWAANPQRHNVALRESLVILTK
ncbi:MAG: site-specific DNA-methyltransferase [Nitrospirota bacterium]